MQKLGKHLAVMNVGCRCYDGVHDLLRAIDADVHFHPEVPLIALLGLMHLRIAFAILILVDLGAVMIDASTIVPPEFLDCVRNCV